MANYFYRLTHQIPWESTISEVKLHARAGERIGGSPPTNCGWAAAPFPSAVPGAENVTVCSVDTLVIPRAQASYRCGV